MFDSQSSASSQDAAILLMRMRQVASDEVRNEKKSLSAMKIRCIPLSPPKALLLSNSPIYSGSSLTTGQANNRVCSRVSVVSPTVIPESPVARCRTVSISYPSDLDNHCTSGLKRDAHAMPASPRIFASRALPKLVPVSRLQGINVVQSKANIVEDISDQPTMSLTSVGENDENKWQHQRTKAGLETNTSSYSSKDIDLDTELSNSSKLVGTTVQGSTPVRDVLRKKFSWKSFPALENYLITNRTEYFECSNQLNYTAEQKRFNNRLTQGLLNLAAEEGYLFEGFTFAALRDRIRCYYKSYVQAAKKKKNKFFSSK